jgi:DNA-binding CsgD family transcriptional regulator
MHADRRNVPSDPEMGASLIEAARGGTFAEVLLAAAQRFDDVAEVFAYSVPDGGRPKAICSSGGLCNSAECAENYARSYYRYDPAMKLLEHAAHGSGFAQSIPAATINRADYRAQCFEQQSFIDKVCFGWRASNQAFVVAFYRNTQRELGGLAALADVGLSALVNAQAAFTRCTSVPLVARLELRLRQRYPELSAREVQICARTLAGWTADDAAADLGIRLGTVLTYRQRAYQRFGFSRVNEFLARLLD